MFLFSNMSLFYFISILVHLILFKSNFYRIFKLIYFIYSISF